MLNQFKKLLLGSILILMVVVLGACSEEESVFLPNFYLGKDFTIASLGDGKTFTQTYYGKLKYSATEINPIGKKAIDFTTQLQSDIKTKLEKMNTGLTVDVEEAVILSGEVEGNQTLVVTVEVTITDRTSPDKTQTESYVFTIHFGTGLDKWDGITATKITPTGNVYDIHNGSHLAWIAEQSENNNFADKTVRFMQDVDMDNKTFTGIGEFAGRLEGNHKTIYGLMIDKQGARNVGLVSVLGIESSVGGSIDNLTIASGQIKGKSFIGAFVGRVATGATVTIKGVTNHATVTGTGNYVGGLVGDSNGTLTIDNSSNTGNVNGFQNVGGFMGSSGPYALTVTDSSNRGNIISRANPIGGLVGDSAGNVTLTNVYSYAKSLTGKISRGGIVGLISKQSSTTFTMNNVYWLYDTADSVVGIESSYGTAGYETGVPVLNNSNALDIAEFKDTTNIGTNFIGWDFTQDTGIWIMGTEYPLLR